MERTVQMCQLDKLGGHLVLAFWAAASPSVPVFCVLTELWPPPSRCWDYYLQGKRPAPLQHGDDLALCQLESSGHCISLSLGQLL